MATKFVFNPFTGTFDVVGSSSWDNLECNVPDYIIGRPVVLSTEGYLKTADMAVTFTSSCKIEDLEGNTIYVGTPYFP